MVGLLPMVGSVVDVGLALGALGAFALAMLWILRPLPAKVGQHATDFTLPDQAGRQVTLSHLDGRWVALVFYPRADTPG